MDKKIETLLTAVNSTEADKSKKINEINNALKGLLIDGKFSVPKEDNSNEKEDKIFDGTTTNDEIASIIEFLIKDETDQNKKEEYKTNLTNALGGARDALSNLNQARTIQEAITNEQSYIQTDALAAEVAQKSGRYSTEELKALTKKTWKELRSDVKYIKTIQKIIIDTGAKHTSINDEILTNGIYGRGSKAGIKTLQTYLNKTYSVTWQDLGCKNDTPDGFAGPATLAALLTMDGDKTRLEKIIADHNGIEPIPPESSNAVPTTTPQADQANPGGPEKFEEKQATILSNIKKIKGLEGVKDLSSLGITVQQDGKTDFGESGLARKKDKDNNNFDIILATGYKVENGKIVKENTIGGDGTDEAGGNTATAKNNEAINTQEYKDDGRYLIFKGKDNNSYYLNKRVETNSCFIMESNNRRSLSIDNDIDKILASIGDNPSACATLIDMSTRGRGTYDIPLEKILNHIIEKESFIDVANAYKKLGFSNNNKNNLLEMLMKETYTKGGPDGDRGYDGYFVKFFEGLLQQYPGTVKKILLKSDIEPTYELLNSEKFTTRKTNYNIQRTDGKRQ